MYYLVDCNQFFVSCEQVFAPKLLNRPVVVLSSNDGCVVARSREAKKLGIAMGVPAYQCRDLFKQHGVVTLSSNFALYSDMSQRVMQVLEKFCDDLEVYSIDEAFLWSEEKDPISFAKEIRKTVGRWTGIGVSIGIAKTKTLAKVASDLAKNTKDGVCLLDGEEGIKVLKKLPVEEVWGIGRRLKERLNELRITTAWEVATAEPTWLKRQFSVMLLRTSLELQGISCLDLEESPELQDSILRSRSFGQPVTDLEELKEALAMHVAKAAAKLREQDGVARVLCVFLMTSRFLKDPFAASQASSLATPTSYTPHLIAKAHELITSLYRPGLVYKKVGVILSELAPKQDLQGDFWEAPLQEQSKHANAMLMLDAVQNRFGNKALRFAAEGLDQNWEMKQSKRTPHYTTSWEELLEI